jgi:hypothetical protein
MGNGNNPSIKADLFSEQQSPDTPSSSASEAKSSSLRIDETAAASSQSYALPKNLQSAIRYLDDDQLDRLLAAALAEQRRRRKKVPVSDKSPRKALVKVAAPPLPQGKLNAIRAAFKAGFTPSRIARQFRISLAWPPSRSSFSRPQRPWSSSCRLQLFSSAFWACWRAARSTSAARPCAP